jgi:hypothetical protein
MDLEFFGGNLSAGGEIYGNYIEGDMTGYISRQSLRENHTEQAAVGYLYSENATNNLEMLHDFNRELEGPYTDNTPNLPLSGNTFDVFTATASDLGVSFRPH